MEAKNMTVGKPGKLLMGFALPLMLGNIFQQLYTFVDTLVVGQALGVNALAALGAAEWLCFLMFGFIQALTQGFSVVISQKFGAGKERECKEAVKGALLLSAAGAVLLTAAGQIMVSPVLRLMRTPEQIRRMTEVYLRILYAGVPLTFGYHMLAAILRALGNSKTPLQAMTISSLCNMTLDVVFVFGFKWGIQGAAAATLIAEAVSALFCLVRLGQAEIKWPQSETDQPVNDRTGWKHVLREQWKLGFPMGCQNLITAVGGLIVQSVINGFGVLFIAGYTAANKLYGLLEIMASSYGYAMSTYAGQNRGAGRPDRIRKGLVSANLMGIATAFAMSCIMLIFGKPIMGFFLTGEKAMVEAAMQIGYRFLTLLSVFFPFLYILYILRACIQGIGNSILPMISSIAQLVMRIGCALILPAFIGGDGIFWGEVCAWLGADLILTASYYGCMRKWRRMGQ